MEQTALFYKTLLDIKNPIEFMSTLNNVAFATQEKIIHEYQDNIKPDKDLLKNFLLCLEKAYTVGVSPVRDEDYDTLMSIYEDTTGGKIIRGDMLSSTKVKHIFPDLKGTIRKCHYMTEMERLKDPTPIATHKSIEKWVRDSMKILHEHSITDVELCAYPKFDGVSIILGFKEGKCISAITRGDKELGTGENRLNVFKNLRYDSLCNFYKDFNMVGLKCEAIMSIKLFPEYNEKYGNNKLIDERAAVNSILNSDNPTEDQISYITLIPLMIQYGDHIRAIPEVKGPFELWDNTYRVSSEGNTDELIDSIPRETIKITDFIKHSEYKCDGVVFRLESEPDDSDINDERTVFKVLGRNEDECVNNFERAYKFRPIGHKTTLVDIVQDIGLMGKVSFTAKVIPIEINKKTISSVSLGSYARMKLLKLRKGDEVIIKYDIIPYLIKDESCKESKNPVIEPIVECPYCHQALVMNPELSCINLDCPSRIIGKIYNYCEKLNMYNIGESTIETLYHNGLVKSILDLYTLEGKKEEFIAIEGFGKKTFKAMIKEINSHTELTPDQFLGSLGIPGISRKTFAKILNKVPFEKIIKDKKVCLKKKTLENIDGIKEKTIMKILEGLMLNEDLIEELLNYVTIIQPAKSDDSIHVCFSLVRNNAFEDHLRKQGIIVDDSVTKHTNILIAARGESGKIDKANKYNIPIISIEDAYRRFKYEA